MWTQVVVFGAGAAVATLILLRRSKANGRLASPDPSVDWSTVTAAQLPPPSSIVPAGLLEHVGRWEGTYTHIAPDGTVTDKHECCLEIGIHGVYYSQRNTYVWRDDSGVETKREVHYFPGQFDESGIVWVQADKIYGYGRTMDTNGTVLFYGGYAPGKKGGMGVAASINVDTFDLIRIVDKKKTHRYRTWQVKANEDLLKIVHVDERRAHSENTFWIPLAERSTPHVDLIVLNGP